jgi:hypothetical protein
MNLMKVLRRSTHRPTAAVIAVGLFLGLLAPAQSEAQTVCGKHYVSGGDDVPAGNTISASQTYPSHLQNDHLAKFGYCNYNLAQNGTTSSTYITGGQLATTWNRAPDFITLTVGEQNTPIVNEITSCFDNVKSHDFASALSCATSIQANTSAFTALNNNLITILQQYKMIMAGRPWLVVAVVGYPNPFPQSSDVTTAITQLCQGTTDTILSCNTRWQQLPPALTALDSVIKQLNTTIANAVQPFNTGYQGRFIFVNPYQKFLGHEMKMDVTLRLDQVCHLCGTEGQYIDNHSSEQNVGSSNPWFQAGSDGTDTPFYLQPPDQINDPPVVLVMESQTTSGMGVYPNDTGNKCISDLVWEAVKWKLGIPEPLNNNICQ